MKVCKNGVMVDATPEEIAEIQAKENAHNEWKASIQYKLNRKAAYPSIAEQLDQIYHEGIDAWKTTIAAVKAEYPKP